MSLNSLALKMGSQTYVGSSACELPTRCEKLSLPALEALLSLQKQEMGLEFCFLKQIFLILISYSVVLIPSSEMR